MLRNPGGSAVTPGGVVTSSTLLLPSGTASDPGWQWAADADGSGTGMYRRAANSLDISTNGTGQWEWNGTTMLGAAGTIFGWSSGTIGSGVDTALTRVSANSIRQSSGSTNATSRTELNATVASISDAVATAALTITIPNAAQSASLLVRMTGSLGAGGAIGANEATATNSYIISLTRTAGVNATAAISAAFGAAATAVAGAATVTCTAAMSAVAGAVGATNTFTVNVTITKSGGASTNHTCLVYAQLMNANGSGITIA